MPVAALSLAARNNIEEQKNFKREDEERKRQNQLSEVCEGFNVQRAEIFNSLLNGFN